MTTLRSAELARAYGKSRVLVTGHTGFKGGWLTLWLRKLGAEVFGYSLAPEASPNLYETAGIGELCRHFPGDVRDLGGLQQVVDEVRPDYVFHLAAQALVRRSYERPVETIETNVLGTAHLLEALRRAGHPCACVIVTSDKCYENREWVYGYRETEAMGGHDVYSMSKGAAELVVASYRRSFFAAASRIRVATARAGNVIGGGDWAADRIIPDAVRALAAGRPIPVRNPAAVRPWQHVLEPLGGYLLLGSRLASTVGEEFCEAWNFGPRPEDARPVEEVVRALIAAWGSGSWEDRRDPSAPHEAMVLRLSTEKAQTRLGWTPRWRFGDAIGKTAGWYRFFAERPPPGAVAAFCGEQITEYLES